MAARAGQRAAREFNVKIDLPAHVPAEDDPAIELPDFAPDLELVVPRPWWWGTGKDPHYCVLPFRVCRDRRFRRRSRLLLVFAALCGYTSKLGITYVSQERICALTGFDKADVSRDLKELEAWGYIKRLRSGCKRTHHALRRLVTYDGSDQPIPRGETEMNDFRVPWVFRDRSINQAVTNEGGNNMMVTSTRKIDAPITQNEIAARNHEARVSDDKLLAETSLVARHFAEAYGARTRKGTQANASHGTARRWLMLGFTVRELCRHIDTVVAEVEGELPQRLGDYREPVR